MIRKIRLFVEFWRIYCHTQKCLDMLALLNKAPKNLEVKVNFSAPQNSPTPLYDFRLNPIEDTQLTINFSRF